MEDFPSIKMVVFTTVIATLFVVCWMILQSRTRKEDEEKEPEEKEQKNSYEKEVRLLFKKYDEDRSGTLSAAELKELCKELGSELDDDELMARLGR